MSDLVAALAKMAEPRALVVGALRAAAANDPEAAAALIDGAILAVARELAGAEARAAEMRAALMHIATHDTGSSPARMTETQRIADAAANGRPWRST